MAQTELNHKTVVKSLFRDPTCVPGVWVWAVKQVTVNLLIRRREIVESVGAKEKDISANLQMFLTRVRRYLQRSLNYTSLTRKVVAAETDVAVSLDLLSLFWLLSAATFIVSSKDDLYSATDGSYLE